MRGDETTEEPQDEPESVVGSDVAPEPGSTLPEDEQEDNGDDGDEAE